MSDFQPLQCPPFLQPGDLVKVISPSGRIREFSALEKSGEIWQSRGYRLEFSPHWHLSQGYLAGSDRQRRQGLADAWWDQECKAILCARGGYGSMRLLEDWNWVISKGKNQQVVPKWVIGFSDVTALLWSLAKFGFAGLHGPVLTTLALEPPWSLRRLFNWLEKGDLEPLKGEGWGGGRSQGFLLPANLTVATHILGTPLQPSLNGVILALEDVGEVPYRIDRMLTQWRLMGVFQGIKGIALGRFSNCDPLGNASSWTVAEVLRDRLGDLGIPIVAALPFGHDGVNAILPVGCPVILDGDQGTLSFCPHINSTA